VEVKAEECASDIEDLIRELSDDNRDKFIDEDDKLNTKELAASVKAMKKDPDLRDEQQMALQALLDKQKDLNKQLKRLREDLIDSTCHRIEALTDPEAYMLLGKKWLWPLCFKILDLPDELLASIEADVTQLIKRYSDTLLSVGHEIKNAEKELAELLGELTGDEADMQAIHELQKLLK